MGNKELFKTVLFGGFQKEEVWNYMQEVEACLLYTSHAAELSVSLEVDLHTGENWYDAK